MSGEWSISKKKKKKTRQKEKKEQKNKTENRQVESNDNSEVPDRRETSDIPGLLSRNSRTKRDKRNSVITGLQDTATAFLLR